MNASQKTKKSRSLKPKEDAEEDLIGIQYFSVPNCVNSLSEKSISKVFARGHFCYALAESTNELYSWGMGENYVLGTREEDNEFEPVLVNPKQFMEKRVKHVGTGVQHIVVLTTADKDPSSRIPQFDKDSLTKRFELPKEEIKEEKKQEEEVLE